MQIQIKAEKRNQFGRKVKGLRKKGILPANIYGKKIKSEAIAVNLEDFEKVYKQAGETTVVYIEIGKERRPVLIHNVQKDPVNDSLLHVDFHQVDLKEKVTTKVPVIIIGESLAEKQGLGTVIQYVDEIEIEALPTDIPESFELSADKLLQLDDQIKVEEISYDKDKINILEDKEKVIVRVEPLRKEEELGVKPEEVSLEEQKSSEEKDEQLEEETKVVE